MTEKIINGYRVGYEEALHMMNNWEPEKLFTLANNLREHFQGRNISTCVILNAKSGRCSEDCKWCAQSAHYKTGIETYSLLKYNDMYEAAHEAQSAGVHKFSLVASGRKLSSTEVKYVAHSYKKLGNELNKISLCGSFGLLTKEELQELYDAGMRMYHCNIETAPSFFPNICSTHTIEEKLQTLAWAKEVGLAICSGGILGMGESIEQRVEMAICLQNIGADSIPVNILMPIAGTPMMQNKPLSDSEILKAFAIFRITNPQADVRFAAGRISYRHIQEKALKCGISAALVGNLLTTVGSNIEQDMKMFRSLRYNV